MQNNNQDCGLKRNIIDKFYTNKNIVNYCIIKCKEKIKFNENDLIIEPSAGNGSFIEPIKKLSKNFLFFDIEPKNKEITKQDYLLYDYKQNINKYNNIHIIGNPPFGRQSSLY